MHSKRVTAAMATKRLSPHHGPVQVSDERSFVPVLKHSDRPAPTWIPFTTGIGVTRFAQLINPVMLNTPTRPATTNPAAAFCSSVNCRAIATAAMAFIGCTGSGIPKARPVSTFAAPVKRRVEGSDIEFVRTRVVMSGSSVPRSPSEPDSSANGWDFIVSMLCSWVRRKRRVVLRTCWRKDMTRLAESWTLEMQGLNAQEGNTQRDRQNEI